MGIFEILLFFSITAVVAAIEAIFRYRKRKDETQKMIEDFERRHPVEEKKKK